MEKQFTEDQFWKKYRALLERVNYSSHTEIATTVEANILKKNLSMTLFEITTILWQVLDYILISKIMPVDKKMLAPD